MNTRLSSKAVGSWLLVLMQLAVLPAAAARPSDPVKCQRVIAKENSKLVKGRAKALQSCEDKKLKGRLASTTLCAAEPKTAKKLAKVSSKFRSKIAKACGGVDQVCGTGGDDL